VKLLELLESNRKPSDKTIELIDRLIDIQKLSANQSESRGKQLDRIFYAICAACFLLFVLIFKPF